MFQSLAASFAESSQCHYYQYGKKKEKYKAQAAH